MPDNTDLLNRILERLDEQGSEVKAMRKEHGEKLDRLEAKVDRLEDGQSRTHTALKSLQGTIEETKQEVDEIKRRQRPQKVD